MTFSDDSPANPGPQRLDQAFADYLDLKDRGQTVNLTEFLRGYPDCAEELRECIEAEFCIQALAEVSRGPASSEESSCDIPVDQSTSESDTQLLSARRSDAEAPTAPTAAADPEQLDAVTAQRVLGDYEIVEVIARGGMGIVYKARQQSLNRIVAVKVIMDGQLATPTAIKRFHSEAQSAARLQHPHIVSIHEIGEQNGLQFFSMDFIEGQSLADVLHHGPLAPRRAAQLVARIAEAIAYAHHRGLLHRDLKPSNILLDQRDEPHVTDFGLARSLNGDSELTKTGEIVGTVSYMSPEQTAADRSETALGPQSDVYSLGAVLYALLVGHPPFHTDSTLDTLLQVRTQEPVPPRVLNPKVPRDLNTICLKCLEKSPAQRYETAEQLARDLQHFLAGQPIQAKPVSLPARSWRWCLRHRAASVAMLSTACLILVTMTGITAYSIHVKHLNTRLGRSNAKLTETRAVLLESQASLQSALGEARQARDRALRSEQHVQDMLYAADMRSASRALREGDVREVVQLLETHIPTSSETDRRGIEWQLLRQLATAPHVGLAGHTGDVYALKYSPDGRRLASAGEDGCVRLYDTQADPHTPRLQHTIPICQDSALGLAFSPNGATIACCCEDGRLRLFETRSATELWTVRAHPDQCYDAAWSADGQTLFSCGNDRWVRGWNPESGTPAGQFGPHASDKAVRRMTVSADGNLLATATDSYGTVWELSTGKKLYEYHGTTRITSAASSPDSQWIAFGSLESRTFLYRVSELAVASSTGTEPPQPEFASHEDGVEGVAFSADSRWAAAADRGGMVTVWPLVPTRSDEPTDSRARRLLAHSGRALTVAFSPDGKQLATAGQDGQIKIWFLETLHQPSPVPTDSETMAGDVAYLADNRPLLMSGSSIRDPKQTSLVTSDQLESPHLTSFAVAFQARQLFVGSYGGTIHIWDVESQTLLETASDPELGIVQSLDCTADGTVVAASTEHGLAVFRAPRLERIAGIPQLNSNAVAVSASGRALAVSRKGHDNIELWEIPTGQQLHTLPGHSAAVNALSFSADERWIASASEDRLVKLWDVATGELRHEFSGHRSRVTDVHFSPDGRSLLSTGWDGTLRVWSAELGRELIMLGTLRRPQRGHFKLAVAPDGRQLAHCADGRVFLYSAGVK